MAPLNIVATTAFYRWSFVVLLCLAFARIDGSQASSQQCERLKAAFTYTQEDAPRDVSVVVRFGGWRIRLDAVVYYLKYTLTPSFLLVSYFGKIMCAGIKTPRLVLRIIASYCCRESE
jgi:hypothetical protein